LPHLPDWSLLLGLRSNGLLRVGQFGLIGVPLLAHLWTLVASFGVHPPPFPAAWKIAFIVSATLFAGNAFVDACCPPEVKRYLTEDAYKTAILSSYQVGAGYRSHVEQASMRSITNWIVANDANMEALVPGWSAAVADQSNRAALVTALLGVSLARDADLAAIDAILRQFGNWPRLIHSAPCARAAAATIYVVGGVLALRFGVVSGLEAVWALS
jgi:hypothetical protein